MEMNMPSQLCINDFRLCPCLRLHRILLLLTTIYVPCVDDYYSLQGQLHYFFFFFFLEPSATLLPATVAASTLLLATVAASTLFLAIVAATR